MRRTAAVAALVVAVVVAGCSDEAEPSTLPAVETKSSGGSESSTPQPSPSVTPTALALPSEPVGTAPAAAAAFARHFFQIINDAYLTRKAEAVRDLSAESCGSCAAVVADVQRLASEGHQVAGRRYILDFAEAAPAMRDGVVLVDFRFHADPYVERDGSSAIVREFPAEPARDGQMLLAPAGAGWQVTAIRLLE